VERFEIYIAGMECGDNWSEQNDPVRLLETWRKAYRADERDAGKFHTLDFDFIEALEYGMPPTTGIGPGIERMAMIFTGQENIDDVIFFPMMRPTVSPLNAAIYGIQESVAPVEDLALSREDFEALCRDGAIKPHARNLTVKPHIRIWKLESGEPFARCHVDIEGVFPNSVLRVTDYKIEVKQFAAKLLEPQFMTSSLMEDKKAREAIGLTANAPAQFLKQTFPDCEVTVSPATVLTQ
jgi:tRNA synthetases class II (D, K and N)